MSTTKIRISMAHCAPISDLADFLFITHGSIKYVKPYGPAGGNPQFDIEIPDERIQFINPELIFTIIKE